MFLPFAPKKTTFEEDEELAYDGSSKVT